MVKKSNLNFEQVKQPIKECISKFGGQPNWVNEPEWPLSKNNDEKMQFVGQIELIDELFGETKGKMAYIFFDFDEAGVGSPWDPDAGFNAVIIQPGNTNKSIKTLPDATGPIATINKDSLYKALDESGCAEFKVNFDISDEPNYLNDAEIDALIDEGGTKYTEYANKMEVSKIGGNPFFVQGEELPIEENWKLLCQLDDGDLPIWVSFGCGVAYAFIDLDGTYGKILWQC